MDASVFTDTDVTSGSTTYDAVLVNVSSLSQNNVLTAVIDRRTSVQTDPPCKSR